MKANTIREQTSEELSQLNRDTRKELFDLRTMKGAGGAGEQPLRTRSLRRDLARILTVMRERELKNGANEES